MTQAIKYTIPMIPPSLNAYAGRHNYEAYRRTKAEWIEIVAACCRPKPSKPFDRSVVSITYHFPDRRRRDPDNYLKFLLDGLSHAGIIKDDDFNHITLVLRSETDRKNPRVEIEVTEE